MQHLRSLPPLVAAALLLAVARPAAAATVTGQAGLDGGHLDHPLGISGEPAAGYALGRLDLQVLLDEAARWRVTYAGRATRFAPDVPLDDTRQALGVEWIRPRARDGWTLSAGLQGAARRQIDTYRVYDHEEVAGYLAFKTYPHPRLMLRGWTGLRLRRYRDLPEESYLEPHAVLEAKRFGDDRTTLGASVRLGGKAFHDPVAPRVWGTDGTPVTAQVVATLHAAKGLSDRVGVRLRGGWRVGLRGFPYYVEADLYDSPLLDRYARSGPSALAALKWLAPLQTWCEVGAGWTDDDYGAILFADGAGGGSRRRDTLVDVFASLERRWLRGGRGAVLRLEAAWRDQDSNLPAYAWSGAALGAGLAWRF